MGLTKRLLILGFLLVLVMCLKAAYGQQDDATVNTDQPASGRSFDHVASSIPFDKKSLKELNKKIDRHYKSGDYSQAAALGEVALKITKDLYDADHPRVITALNNLALFYKLTERLDKAEQMYREAISLNEMSGGADHSETSTVIGNLAMVCLDQKKYGEPHSIHNMLLGVCGRSLRMRHPIFARLGRTRY